MVVSLWLVCSIYMVFRSLSLNFIHTPTLFFISDSVANRKWSQSAIPKAHTPGWAGCKLLSEKVNVNLNCTQVYVNTCASIAKRKKQKRKRTQKKISGNETHEFLINDPKWFACSWFGNIIDKKNENQTHKKRKIFSQKKKKLKMTMAMKKCTVWKNDELENGMSLLVIGYCIQWFLPNDFFLIFKIFMRTHTSARNLVDAKTSCSIAASEIAISKNHFIWHKRWQFYLRNNHLHMILMKRVFIDFHRQQQQKKVRQHKFFIVIEILSPLKCYNKMLTAFPFKQ